MTKEGLKSYFDGMSTHIKNLVGTAGFEPATPCPPDKYATRLRYAPNRIAINDEAVL